MAGQTLTTTILINAKTGNGFSAVGATLTELGSLVSNISDPLIEFGKDSLRVYRDYEDSMKDAEVALSTTYGRGTRELNNVMKELDSAASEWAANSIFHTNDVANAIAETSHAGWNLNQIMSGIPAAMELAQAGGIDLSTAVDYIVKSANAAKIPFEDIGEFIDHWAFAANSSSTDIDEMGQALIRLGGTSQFAENTDELLSMLAVLGDVGSVGSEAGTLLRNTMIRLVAPTDKAKEVMDGLGVEAGELDAALSDESLVAASEMLEQVGFSAYDQEGNLKSFSQTFLDLNDALGKIEREDDANAILSAIFPTRTITGAKALLDGVTEKWETLYDTMQSGEAEGYGQYASETRMESLSGSLELFESKVEELKRAVGEDLAPDVMGIAEALGGFVDSLSGMDDAAFAGLVGGLEVIAAAGPGLIIAGTGFRLVGSALSALGTPAGAIILTAFAVGALASALEAYDNVQFENQFGENSLDAGKITAAVDEIRDAFDAGHEKATAFSEAFEAAVSSYSNLTSKLTSDLLSDAISGNNVTQKDLDNYLKLGEQIGAELKIGLEQGLSKDLALANYLYGSENPEDITDPMWAQINSIMTEGYDEAIGNAGELSRQLRDAMTSAFKDGTLTGDEVSGMQNLIKQMNELLEEEQAVYFSGQKAMILQRAQALGLDSVDESVRMMREEREREAEYNARMYGEARQKLINSYEKYGGYTDEAGNWVNVSEDSFTALLADWDQRYADKVEQDSLATNAMIAETREAALRYSPGLGDTYAAVEDLLSGELTQDRIDAFASSVDWNSMRYLQRYQSDTIRELGGLDAIGRNRDYLLEQGDTESAATYQNALDVFSLLQDYMGEGIQEDSASRFESTVGQTQTLLDRVTEIFGAENMGALADVMGEAAATGEDLGIAINRNFGNNPGMMESAQSLADETGYGNNLAGVASMLQSVITPTEQAPAEVQGESIVSGIADAVGGFFSSFNPLDYMGQTIASTISGGTTSTTSTTDTSGATQKTQEDVTAAYESHFDATAVVDVEGESVNDAYAAWSQSRATFQSFYSANPINVTAPVVVTPSVSGAAAGGGGGGLFAEGGRATQASIFGEAGPEWAIPEEHTSRTAALLNEARQASGFSWEELLTRYGGFNSDVNHVPATVIYSPTINANDATGVENVLADDKNRLMKWFKEMQAREEMEVFA